MLYFLCSFCFLFLRCVLLLRSCVDRSIKLLAFYRLSKCTIPSGYGLARFLCAYLVEQIHALQAQFALRKPTILASEFVIKNFLVDAGLWHCVEIKSADHELDQRALAKINLPIKLVLVAIPARL
ncbi:hypothetical protein T4D_172 [Trichinella pseudospiralis]|uniref:Uncharacterized protein n=1 Tax=Trichinella pseudospiralis TaxID=6337 RepID=A0A0V1F7A9_TRIPS|nr:hypothetical protein T4D_172 [Trichinella pseudospiralis]